MIIHFITKLEGSSSTSNMYPYYDLGLLLPLNVESFTFSAQRLGIAPKKFSFYFRECKWIVCGRGEFKKFRSFQTTLDFIRT